MRRIALATLFVGASACSLFGGDDLTGGGGATESAVTRDSGSSLDDELHDASRTVTDGGGTVTVDSGAASDAATSETGSGTTDATALDTGTVTPVDAGADGGAPLPNLITNGDFEAIGGNGCGGKWFGYNATITSQTTSPHGGRRVCRACSKNSQSYDLDELYDGWHDAAAGQSFHLSAWVRAATGSMAITMDVRLYAPGSGLPSGAPLDWKTVGPLTLTSQWQEMTMDYVAPQDGRIDVFFPTDGSFPSTCYEVDDVRLTATTGN